MTWTADDTAAALRSIAAWDLPGARPIRVPDHPESFADFAAELQRTRLLGPLLTAHSLGEVDLPEDLRADLVTRQQGALLWCIELEKRLLQVHDWFAPTQHTKGIEYRVIKGPAVAHLDTLEPSLRTFADIDLLIAADDMDRAVAILTRHGATRPWAERRPGFDRRFVKSVTMTFADGIELDLHRTLADGVHGHRIPLADLFADADHFDIGGVSLAALKPVHRLLHSAYHLLLGSREPALMNLRDLAGYLCDPSIQVVEVTAEATRWRGEAVLALAIDLVAERLDVQPARWTDWRAAQRLDPTELALIERHRSEGSSLGRAKLDVARELPGVRTKLAYLTALAWPSREHLESRGLRRRDDWTALQRILRR